MNKLFCVICALLTALNLFGESMLGQAANSIKPGAWSFLRADSLSGDMIMTGPVSDIIYAFSNSACWDTKTKQLLYVGGPHMAPMKFNIYRESTNGWRNVPLDNAWISHSYDNFTLDSAGRMNWMHSGKIRVFDAVKDNWVDSFAPPQISSRYGGMEYFPEKNALVYVLSGSVYYCPLATKVWQTLKTGLAMGGIHNIAEYNVKHKKIYFGGGDGSKALYSLDTSLKVVKEPDAPIVYRIAGALMTCDYGSGHVLFVDSSGVYFYDPASNSSGKAAKSMVRRPDQAVIAPISDYGVIAFLTVSTYPFLLYKHNPAVAAVEKNVSLQKENMTVSPNPFNPKTSIRLNLKKESNVRIGIFNNSGQRIRNVFAGKLSAGVHPFLWNGKSDNGEELAGGVYLVSIITEGEVLTGKVIYSK
ncbi:MAG: T9SS type A sorting domain-containing protein [Fibrobacteres bacterium]|nr:T9SS type A sorting domain-containing protein [Fibrobacterota bacterium]